VIAADGGSKRGLSFAALLDPKGLGIVSLTRPPERALRMVTAPLVLPTETVLQA
jgi:hypothetical protein